MQTHFISGYLEKEAVTPDWVFNKLRDVSRRGSITPERVQQFAGAAKTWAPQGSQNAWNRHWDAIVQTAGDRGNDLSGFWKRLTPAQRLQKLRTYSMAFRQSGALDREGLSIGTPRIRELMPTVAKRFQATGDSIPVLKATQKGLQTIPEITAVNSVPVVAHEIGHNMGALGSARPPATVAMEAQAWRNGVQLMRHMGMLDKNPSILQTTRRVREGALDTHKALNLYDRIQEWTMRHPPASGGIGAGRTAGEIIRAGVSRAAPYLPPVAAGLMLNDERRALMNPSGQSARTEQALADNRQWGTAPVTRTATGILQGFGSPVQTINAANDLVLGRGGILQNLMEAWKKNRGTR